MKDKAISKIIINHINAGNLELNGICVNDLVKDIMSTQETGIMCMDCNKTIDKCDCTIYSNETAKQFSNVTHWMPLPDTPAESKQDKEHSEKHETCDDCKMFIDNLCQLDVSRCPDCFERSMWTPRKKKKIKGSYPKIEQQPKGAKEILLSKFPLLPKSSDKKGIELIIEAMHEHTHQSRRKIIEDWMEYLEEEVIDIVYQNDEQEKEYLIKQYLNLKP